MDRVEEGLRAALVAMNDWLCTYADDLVGEEAVKDAWSRVGQYGTLGYISEVTQKLNAALDAHLNPHLPHRLSPIEWLIERWHQGEGDDLELPAWLGWTEEEYSAWVRDPKMVPDRALPKR